jgi:hypothetical protein
MVEKLKSDKEEITYLKWSSDVIYIETRNRKTLSYFKKHYHQLENIEICDSPSIEISKVLGEIGSAKTVRLSAQKKSGEREKLNSLFIEIRETKIIPDLREDIDHILDQSSYEKVFQRAKRLNFMENYSLNLRPWQKEVIKLLNNQSERQILWVFDLNGNSGKSKLAEYLEFKKSYYGILPGKHLFFQITTNILVLGSSMNKVFCIFYIFFIFVFTSGSMHNEAGRIDAEAPGYFMDFSRAIANDRKAMLQTFNLIESLKNGVVRSGKYAGSAKILSKRNFVIFSNFMPNLKFLSLDRWQFFHTKLGILYLSCGETFAGKQYLCSITRDENKCDVRSNELPWAEGISDENLITEYLHVFNVKRNFKMFHNNSLAFMPLASYAQCSIIRKMIMKLNHSALYKYILENHCFDEGIITIDFIKKYGCFLESEIDDPDSSESSSNSQSSTSSNSLYYSHESDIQPE